MKLLLKARKFFINLSPRQWAILCFVLFCVMQILLHPEILTTTFFYSEDGSIFFNAAKDGVGAFFVPWGGYLTFLSRLIAGIAYLVMLASNSILAAGETIEILSILMVAFICMYFASDSFSYLIKSRAKRLIIMLLLILLMSNFTAMFYNTVDLHWWYGIMIFFVSIHLVNNHKIERWVLPLVILMILSSPSTFFIVFPCIFAIKKYGFKPNKLQFILIAIALLTQACVVFLVPSKMAHLDMDTTTTVVSNSGNIDDPIDATEYILYQTIFLPYFSLGANTYYRIAIIPDLLYWLCAILGIVVWAITLYRGRKRPEYFRIVVVALAAILTIYIMVRIKAGTFFNPFLFYHSTVAGITFLVFAIGIGKIRKAPILFWAFAMFLFVVLPTSILPMEIQTNNNLVTADAYVDRSSNHIAEVKIVPETEGGEWYWSVHFPVRAEYCEKYECLEKE